MSKFRVWKRPVPGLVTLLVACLAGILGTTVSRGKTMKAEDFFSEQQIAAYRLAQEGQTQLLIKAVASGVNLNKPGKEDMTLLGLAVLTADRSAIVSLMRAGADPNQVIPDAGSPAIMAITKHFNPPVTAAVEALLVGGYDPNQLRGEGTPYLFTFVDYGHWPGLMLALERGGNVNVRRSNGKSLLTYVIERGHYTQARELIKAGADVVARGVRGETALLAIEYDIAEADPALHPHWREMLTLRALILSKLFDPKDRHTAFTDIVEEKIRQNPK